MARKQQSPHETTQASHSPQNGPRGESDKRNQASPPGSSAHILGLQQSLGNTAVRRLVSAFPKGSVQRQPIGQEISRPIATISFQNHTTDEYSFVDVSNSFVAVEKELVPTWAKSGEFEGFETRTEAYAQAWAQDNLAAIVQDAEGRFHALRTDWGGRSTSHSRAAIAPLQTGFGRVWWVNVPGHANPGGEVGTGSWSDRARIARSRYDQWSGNRYDTMTCPHDGRHGGGNPGKTAIQHCLEDDFVALLAEALDIQTDEIWVANSYGDHNPDYLISFDIFMGTTHGKGGSTLPFDRETEMSRATAAVGPSAFIDASHFYPLSTAIHEATHVAHANMADAIRDRWRNSSSKLPFIFWLERELKKGRITQEQYDLTIDMSESKSHDSEILSHLEGFFIIFRSAPKTDKSNLTENLKSIRDYWGGAMPETHQNVLRRLAAFYRKLPEERRKWFDDYVNEMKATDPMTNDEEKGGNFWAHLQSEVMSAA